MRNIGCFDGHNRKQGCTEDLGAYFLGNCKVELTGNTVLRSLSFSSLPSLEIEVASLPLSVSRAKWKLHSDQNSFKLEESYL